MQYFKLQNLEFEKLINDMAIDLCHLKILQIWRIYKDNIIQWLTCQNLHPIKNRMIFEHRLVNGRWSYSSKK